MNNIHASLTILFSALLFACTPAPASGPSTAAPANANTTAPTGPAEPVVNEPVAKPDQPPATDGCSREIAIRCRAPFTDGCNVAHPTDASRKLTTEHRCVSAKPTSTPCAQEIALECGEGAIDSCLLDPPAGDVHFCVAN